MPDGGFGILTVPGVAIGAPGSVVAPVANFVASTLMGNAPLSVQFTDLSTNTPTSWAWNFGDGQTSTLQNPSHTYNQPGEYTVSLTATNAGGSNTATKVNYITAVKTPSPTPTSRDAEAGAGRARARARAEKRQRREEAKRRREIDIAVGIAVMNGMI